MFAKMKLHTCKHLLIWSALAVFTCLAQDAAPALKAPQVPEPEMAKRLKNVVAPKLPDGALQKCSNAMVMLKITINETGKVIDEEVTSGYPELKQAAVTAIKQWTYKPFERHGNAITVQTQVSIFFLGDGESFPMYSPDGKGGVKGGNMIPMPPGCGAGPSIKRQPDRPAH
jgi:TonB family protein